MRYPLNCLFCRYYQTWESKCKGNLECCEAYKDIMKETWTDKIIKRIKRK